MCDVSPGGSPHPHADGCVKSVCRQLGDTGSARGRRISAVPQPLPWKVAAGVRTLSISEVQTLESHLAAQVGVSSYLRAVGIVSRWLSPEVLFEVVARRVL